MSLNPRLRDKLPEPFLRTGSAKYDVPIKNPQETPTGWRVTTRKPTKAPEWVNERLVVACDNMYEEDEEFEYHIAESGEYRGKFTEKQALEFLKGLFVEHDIEITPEAFLSFARHWCCASLAHKHPRGRQEMLGDRWNLSEVFPAEVWRRFAIGWRWVDYGSGYIPR